MRDVLIVAIVGFAALVAMRHGWVGVMLWTWLSLMNPHRYSFGFAYEAPLAALAAGVTLIGVLTAQDRSSPFKGVPVAIFVVFNIWITLSWLAGLDPVGDYPQWTKIMKINVMLIIALVLLHDKRHIMAFAWVCALSLGLLGAKGGLFTLLSGGSYRVWGPPGSFIEDNNEFALSLVITIPLLRFLQLQLGNAWGRRILSLMMILCAAAALGSHSRGGLLAIVAMAAMLWWRGSNKVRNGLLFLILGIALVAFMPQEWASRMDTINEYQEDASAMGRISAWGTAWNSAFHYPFGVGFNGARPELFERFSPFGLGHGVLAAHSIYFQVLGNHGFVGLFIYLALWITTYRWCGHIRRESNGIPQARWCHDLAGLIQVSLVGFGVGGAFLSLAYFDQPYNLMAMVVLTRAWLRSRAWEREAAFLPAWLKVPGLGGGAQRARAR